MCRWVVKELKRKPLLNWQIVATVVVNGVVSLHAVITMIPGDNHSPQCLSSWCCVRGWGRRTNCTPRELRHDDEGSPALLRKVITGILLSWKYQNNTSTTAPAGYDYLGEIKTDRESLLDCGVSGGRGCDVGLFGVPRRSLVHVIE